MFVVVGGGALLEISVLGEVRVVVVSNLFSNLVYNPYMFQWLPPTLYPGTILPCWGFYFYYRQASHLYRLTPTHVGVSFRQLIAIQ